MTYTPCGICGCEGKIYTSRYGGNDPDVWPSGPCEACEGTGYRLQETEPFEMDDIETAEIRETELSESREEFYK